MSIEKYISDLLYRYQCVIVPNFGAFVAETTPATFNEVTRTFSPPKKCLMFNFLLRNNDGLLANHISATELISFEKATEFIHEQTKIWQQNLDNNQPVFLNNIGVFSKNEDKRIIFEPIGSANYLTSSFGLSTIIAPVILRDQEQVISIEKKVVKHQKSKPNYLKYAAVVMLGLGLFGAYQSYENYQSNQLRVIAVENAVQDKVQKELQQATFFIKAPVVIEEEMVVNTKPYHIVAGAFRTEAKAKILTEELQKKGYKYAKYLEKSKHNMRQVVYNSYETLEEAQADLQLIKKNVNKDAWVYTENQ